MKKPLSFGAVQGNISQNLKWEPGHLDKTIDTYRTLSDDLWQKDILFWPENAIPTFYQKVPGLTHKLKRQAREHKTALVLGIPWYDV